MKTSMVLHRMVKSPYVIEFDQMLRSARDYMKECHIRHLPVYKKGVVVGLVSERDLNAALALDQARLLRVEDIMKTDLYLVRQFTPLQVVVKHMAEHKLGSALVVDQSDALLGIFTTTDALNLLAELLEFDEQEQFALNDSDYWPRDVIEGG